METITLVMSRWATGEAPKAAAGGRVSFTHNLKQGDECHEWEIDVECVADIAEDSDGYQHVTWVQAVGGRSYKTIHDFTWDEFVELEAAACEEYDRVKAYNERAAK